MKLLTWILAITIPILVGGILGIIPYINTLLSLNFWLVIPVGGALLGILMALIQFSIFYSTNALVGVKTALILGLISSISYLASDYSKYRTAKFKANGKEMAIYKVITFEQYMSYRLKKTEYMGRGKGKYTIGEIGTKISYSLHIIAAFLCTYLVTLGIMSQFHFCKKCEKYLKTVFMKECFFANDESFKELHNQVIKYTEMNDIYSIITLIRNNVNIFEKPILKFILEGRECPNCRKSSIYATTYTLNDNNTWKENKDLMIEREFNTGINKYAA